MRSYWYSSHAPCSLRQAHVSQLHIPLEVKQQVLLTIWYDWSLHCLLLLQTHVRTLWTSKCRICETLWEIRVAFAKAKLHSSDVSTCSGSTQLSVHDWARNDLMLFITDVPHCIQTAVFYFIYWPSLAKRKLLSTEFRGRKSNRGSVFSLLSVPCFSQSKGASQKHSHCHTKM